MKSDFINCKNCTDDCHCKGKDITPICISFKPAKITNADRIRAMTDEELARWIMSIEPAACPFRDDHGDDCHFTHCRDCWLDWLKQDYITFVAQEYEKDLNDRLNREGISL